MVILECAAEPLIVPRILITRLLASLSFGMFRAGISSQEMARAQAYLNFNPATGTLTADVVPQWGGDDPLARTLFLAKQNDSAYLSIEKKGSSLVCVDNVGSARVELAFNITPWQFNSSHHIVLVYGDSFFNCTVDGVSKSHPSYMRIDAGDIFVGKDPRQTAAFDAYINLSLNKRLIWRPLLHQ